MASTSGALTRPLTGTEPDYTKSAFVSGAGSGIGRAVTLTLLDHGCHVFAGSFNEAERNSLSGSFDALRVTPVVLDVRDEASTRAAADLVAERLDGRQL